MTALTDLSAIINRLTGGNSGAPEHINWYKQGTVNGASLPAPVVGNGLSLWAVDGFPGFPIAGPGAAAVPNNTTAGGLLQTDPTGGRQKWLLGLECFGSIPGTLMLYDRLCHISGLSGTVITAQTFQGTAGAESPTLTRYTNGSGNFLFYEVYTAIGTTARTITASYTDNDGNTGQTTIAAPIGGAASTQQSRVATAMIMPLASGDVGIRACKEATLSASTVSAAGNFGLTIGHPLATVQCGQNGQGSARDLITGFPAIIEVLQDACLGMLFFPNSTSIPQLWGSVHMIES